MNAPAGTPRNRWWRASGSRIWSGLRKVAVPNLIVAITALLLWPQSWIIACALFLPPLNIILFAFMGLGNVAKRVGGPKPKLRVAVAMYLIAFAIFYALFRLIS
jgi:hypothetical protein